MAFRILGARLLDGNGGAPLENSEIRVVADRITYAGPASGEPWDGPTYNASGYTVMPGLIDAHVHMLSETEISYDQAKAGAWSHSNSLSALLAAPRAAAMLDAGFTTVRDVGAVNEPIFALRDAIAKGAVKGPRIVASGKALTITGGHGTEYGVEMAWEADSAEDLKRLARLQIKAGADLIKIMATTPAFKPPYRNDLAYSLTEMQEVVKAAAAMGCKVAAHAHHTPAEAIHQVVEAGVHSLEHGRPLSQATARLMAERGTYLVPTLSVSFRTEELAAEGKVQYDAGLLALLRRIGQEALEAVATAHAAGARVALGTDAGMPGVDHAGSARELEYMCRAGLSPMESIVAATRNAAGACCLEELTGTLVAGKWADLIVVRGEPDADVRILQDRSAIAMVVKAGAVCKNLLGGSAQ